VTTGKGVITPVIVTATSGEFYKKHKDVVEKFKKAQDEILAFINANEDEALKLTAEETGLSIEAVKSMYPQYDFSSKITAEDIKALEATQEFMLESKMIEQKIDIKSLLAATSFWEISLSSTMMPPLISAFTNWGITPLSNLIRLLFPLPDAPDITLTVPSAKLTFTSSNIFLSP